MYSRQVKMRTTTRTFKTIRCSGRWFKFEVFWLPTRRVAPDKPPTLTAFPCHLLWSPLLRFFFFAEIFFFFFKFRWTTMSIEALTPNHSPLGVGAHPLICNRIIFKWSELFIPLFDFDDFLRNRKVVSSSFHPSRPHHQFSLRFCPTECSCLRFFT